MDLQFVNLSVCIQTSSRSSTIQKRCLRCEHHFKAVSKRCSRCRRLFFKHLGKTTKPRAMREKKPSTPSEHRFQTFWFSFGFPHLWFSFLPSFCPHSPRAAFIDIPTLFPVLPTQAPPSHTHTFG